MPVGLWVLETAAGIESLLISPGGCQFTGTMNGVSIYPIVGTCSWDASGSGGILTIINANAYKPAPVYYTVMWVNPRTISVDGDILLKRD